MKKIVIYSQDGCPYCSELKESLINDGKSFTVKDIEKYESEWELVVERTGNEYVPVACVIDTKTKESIFLAPDRDWDTVVECYEKLKKVL
tara:strand:+ start:111 stop:380 length:270 start_codon:yes stop_codon:yes gene_type:complete